MTQHAASSPTPTDLRGAQIGTAVVTLVLSAATLLGDISGQEPGRILLVDALITLLSTAAAPVLVRRPVIGGVALALLSAVSPAGTPGSSIAAMHLGWRRPLSQAVPVVGLAVAAHLVRWIWRPYPGLTFGWWVVLVAVAAAALLGWGTLIRARSALIASLRERARRAESEQGRRVAEARAQERAAIAREMHDVLAHRLSLLATYAGALEYRPDVPAERLAEAAGVVRAGVHDALDELREVIGVLRDDPEATAGDRPQPELADVRALVAESEAAGMIVTFADHTAGSPTPTTGRTAYRIVQEGLTNARKHAPGQPVDIDLSGSAGGELSVSVTNATSPSGEADHTGGGMGLVGLTERARLLGGTLDHRVTADGHFLLRARLPWPS